MPTVLRVGRYNGAEITEIEHLVIEHQPELLEAWHEHLG